MGFRLIYGNDSDALLDRLAERLRTPHPASSPLAPEIVLVPQFGLRRWLEIRLAEKLGIIANIAFFAPAEYAWRLLRAANPALAEKSGYERELLRWRIYSLLEPLAREHAHEELAVAIGNGDASRRLQFADALAHAYERDLAYRSDRLSRWERGADPSNWRAELWRRLVQTSTQPHRAQLLEDWLRKYASLPAKPPGVPPRLFAFACANISPDLLRFYAALARYAEIDFYLPNPCREYWGDVRKPRDVLRDADAFDSDAFVDVDNPALAAWARAGRDLVERLFSYELVQPEQEEDCSREPGSASLLARLQRDVLDRLPPAEEKAAHDGSIQFHRCHSRLREVQALHDHLLDLFAHDPTLTLRDVAVMSPEIGAYAPHIESVFGGIARDDARYLPYALSDCPVRETHPLVGVALRLIALPTSRLELAEICEWLTLPALQRRFDLDAGDAVRLADWLRDAGVRWGLDAAQHAAVGAGNYAEFTWRFGLERLLLGYASGDLDTAEAELIADIAPDPAVEGTNATVLGAVLRLVDVMADLLHAQHRPHTPLQWQKLYNDTFSQLFDTAGDRDDAQAMERVRETLADFAEETAQAGMTEPLDWRCVRDELTSRLNEPERAFRFFGGGITVCGMVPLRAVPFRVICLIGMNEGAFPRRDRASPFDREEDRKLEPSIRDEDRYLFLQQLMAARDRLYLSWVGEDARDGSRKEPSAVVAELIAILAQYGVDENACVVEHPLQPFSPRLFDGSNSALFTYDPAWSCALNTKPASRMESFVDDSTLPVDTAPNRLEWRQWKRYWRNPAAAYLAGALGIDLARSPETDDDADDLALSGLGRYDVFNALLDSYGKSEPVAQLKLLRARGALPAGIAGEQAFDELQAPLAALSEMRDATNGATELTAGVPFELTFGNLTLIGNTPEHRDGMLVHALLKKAEGQRLLQAWLDYLLLATQRKDAQLILLEWNDGTPQQRRANGVSAEQARAWLGDFATLHEHGRSSPLLFFPKSSQVYAERYLQKRKGDDDEASQVRAAFDVARAAFHSSRFHRGDDAEPAFALVARNIDLFNPESPASREFSDCALRVFAPIWNTLQTIELDARDTNTNKSKSTSSRSKSKAAK